jgi:hypothetical protein
MKSRVRPPLAIAAETCRKKCLTKPLLPDGNSRIIKIRQICRRSASLYYASHQTSLKAEWFCANSGRWNLATPQNSRGYCWPKRTIRTIFSTDFVNTVSAAISNLISNHRTNWMIDLGKVFKAITDCLSDDKSSLVVSVGV